MSDTLAVKILVCSFAILLAMPIGFDANSYAGSGSSSGGGSGGGNSGTGGGNSGSSGSSEGGGGGSVSIHAEVMYERGKKIFQRNVVCDTCTYSDLELSSESVKEVWPLIREDLKSDGSIGINLKRFQRDSIKHFIKERFIRN